MDKNRNLDKYAEAIIEDGKRDGGKPHDLLTEAEMCAWFRRSPQWFQIARSKGYGPKYCKLGRAVRYLRADAIAYLQERTAKSTKDYETHPGPGRPAKKAKVRS
jgi:hypothetical protein